MVKLSVGYYDDVASVVVAVMYLIILCLLDYYINIKIFLVMQRLCLICFHCLR